MSIESVLSKSDLMNEKHSSLFSPVDVSHVLQDLL